jgi:hypothetical protein
LAFIYIYENHNQVFFSLNWVEALTLWFLKELSLKLLISESKKLHVVNTWKNLLYYWYVSSTNIWIKVNHGLNAFVKFSQFKWPVAKQIISNWTVKNWNRFRHRFDKEHFEFGFFFSFHFLSTTEFLFSFIIVCLLIYIKVSERI